MKTLGSLLLLTALATFYTGQVYAETPDANNFKGYKVNCTAHTKQCGEKLDQVCGMDGKTYDNECMLCASAGGPTANVCAKHKGECGKALAKQPRCDGSTIKPCTKDYRPHCGSDGVTYGNGCVYCNQKRNDKSLTLLFEEHCYNEQHKCE